MQPHSASSHVLSKTFSGAKNPYEAQHQDRPLNRETHLRFGSHFRPAFGGKFVGLGYNDARRYLGKIFWTCGVPNNVKGPAPPPVIVKLNVHSPKFYFICTVMASSLCCINSEMVFIVHPLGRKYNSVKDMSPIINFVNQYDFSSSKLRGLTLHGNSYASTSILELVRILIEKGKSFLENIRYVDCSDMFTGRLKEDVPKSLQAIGSLLGHCPGIECLNLSDNAFGPAGANAIAPFLEKLSLTSFLINNNGLGQLGGSIIASSLKSMSTLSIFSIGRNRLENDGAIAIAEAIKSGFSSSLRQFSIFQNGITKNGVLALCDAISTCQCLEILDFQDNTFTIESNFGENATLEADFSKLVLLGLQYNGICDSELQLLIRLVVQMPHLQSLQLNGNSFDPEGPQCTALREAIQRLSQGDVLDSLSDMDSDVESIEQESESEEDISSASEAEDVETEELTEILEKTHVA
ncbi:Ran GAP Rna1 [Mitosporidium daphniae]|uniref:Uncharacterized protein n=1 Tax=Mitosporidium daphniae TaxID=1485682 RepID=A0A098VT36_9MICR|nr:uncharacterized protein DI09_1p120 [Mitosporidium daphniae]KGG52162.1 hypothetical protein DI09_1p120 [Mitosporidium daphniae]|eukprot:XP_013238589.1 uncharacterized protein DI09_1p120 [Mitosporidium daphniae]